MLEMFLDTLAKIGGLPGVCGAIAIAIYLRRQKVTDERDALNIQREMDREKSYQDLLRKSSERHETIATRLSESEKTQTRVLEILAIVVEKLSVVTTTIKDELKTLKDDTDSIKEDAAISRHILENKEEERK